ncbi:hypothetical protein TL16_g01522 [Triparma laevis f. inornata]|uniref:FAD dependent oxidoreductase domain-containing protein n=1 Tax=Triparma laevis f. inornata TaxID=1714386 RepID=A0A9W6ZJ81_9STRA|nr:hypothetical protein TL16_g01522 [Triparma laevis f. inornata]
MISNVRPFVLLITPDSNPQNPNLPSPLRQITIISRDTEPNIASSAAAGMLAPQSERLPKGPLLTLCLSSRNLYSNFVSNLESQTGTSTGYRPTGGFICPAFRGDSVSNFSPVESSGKAIWLDEIQIKEYEPRLSKDVIGGWWFTDDASVDARLLTDVLRTCCEGNGVEFINGDVTGIVGEEKKIVTEDGKVYECNDVVIANGAWMRELLPVPIQPHKGQSFSVKAPPNFLERVLFASDTYIVPKKDGRIVIGATVEPGSFDSSVTVGGMMHCFNAACRLIPGLKDLEIEETWSGLRPTTPDKAPILGETPWENVHVAGGYWRNGVLLAPKTAQLIADSIEDRLSESDAELLSAFKWDRFLDPEGGAKIAVASRYASQMHPVYYKSDGVGVSSSVGSELGLYEGAGAAVDERARDRELMASTNDSYMDAFENAANLGKTDATAFEGLEDLGGGGARSFEGLEERSSAFTVEKKELEETVGGGEDLKSKYEQIMKNKQEGEIEDAIQFNSKEEKPDPGFRVWALDEKTGESKYEQIMKNKQEGEIEDAIQFNSKEEKPDPGFRVWALDEKTGEEILMPPYTSPGVTLDARRPKKNVPDMYEANEKTYDGYVAIQEANGISRDEQLEAMRRSRIKNRGGGGEGGSILDELKMDEFDDTVVGGGVARGGGERQCDCYDGGGGGQKENFWMGQ